jgi:hypothetical protein
MAGLLADLSVAGKLAGRSLGKRLRSEIEPPPDLELFTREMEQLLAAAPEGLVREHCWLHLPATQAPWVASSMSVDMGDEISYFSEGRVYANRLLDIYINPTLQLWCKIGDEGGIFRGTRPSYSCRANTDGSVMFGNYFPNDWADASGSRVQDDSCYQQASGELKVLVIRWHGKAADSLRALTKAVGPHSRLSGELERIDQGDTTPPGWHYLWHIGPAEIYRHQSAADGTHCIHCQTRSDTGILQKDVDLPLDESTEVSWRWCVQQLPSTLREDTLPSHDYLSIAVEFDNGRDITYYWSSKLPVGTGYDCPLPNWHDKEYHVVIRSGARGLNEWQDERRNLHADYLRYMGMPPARVVRVWLIANSIFQRGEGHCDYTNIQLHHRSGDHRLL